MQPLPQARVAVVVAAENRLAVVAAAQVAVAVVAGHRPEVAAARGGAVVVGRDRLEEHGRLVEERGRLVGLLGALVVAGAAEAEVRSAALRRVRVVGVAVAKRARPRRDHRDRVLRREVNQRAKRRAAIGPRGKQ